ncbi:hypothetical protein SETIT_8G094100v2 [Setaria italica]|uniref:DUF1618 domain-containing protein n=2 Tax=Setaria italica TaxID=4555 RepID=A0A368S5Z8_SETIT|nr:hypothetical protein SETIT_8G094100v2 [Setaria italica]
MQTLTNPKALSDPPAARPRWVMLNPYVDNHKDSDLFAADAKTRAASCSSSGQFFSVSFVLAPPPESSRYYCDWIGGAPGDGNDSRHQILPDRDESKSLRIIAAHVDSLLIQIWFPKRRHGFRNANTCDYFLYETGGGARPPTLPLLPGCYVSKQLEREKDARHDPTPRGEGRPRSLDKGDTGMLPSDEGELLVALLEVMYDVDRGQHDTAELSVLRSGRREWELKQLPIEHLEHHEGGELPQWPELQAAVPVGVRFMGFFLCDVEAGISPDKVWYVPLPVPAPKGYCCDDDRSPYLPYCRNLAAAGRDAVRFVNVAPRFCCGGHGKTSCERSRFAFNVTTSNLTLRADGEPMTWVKDGLLDCDELWLLLNYGRLPRVAPKYPIVSSDKTDVVYFVLCENHYFMDNADKTVWMLEIVH